MAADPDASIALPFTPRPQMLTGELVGDVGFDPLGFSEEVSNQGDPSNGFLLAFTNVHSCIGI